MKPFRLATRASPLALWQARWVAQLLRAQHPGLRIELVPIISDGDRDRATPLYASNSVGVFVRAIQAAVLAGDADAGVHSCKDLPTTLPAGMMIAALPPRADARDALIGGDLSSLKTHAVIGTSSLRRQHQLALARPDLRFVDIRGNVETRLRKLAAGEVDATVLALAGLSRLGLARCAGAIALDPWHLCVPAPAQGAVAIDCRSDDARARWLLCGLNDHTTAIAVGIERAVLSALDGGCSLPLGCHVRHERGRWLGVARLTYPDRVRAACASGPAATLAERLLAQMR